MATPRQCLLGVIFAFSLGAGGALAAEPLRYAGATTLQQYFLPEAAIAFEARGGRPIIVQGGNTDPGLSALAAGKIDLAGAGRYLSSAEKAAGLVETLIGWDALVVVVHAGNPVDTLSRPQLQALFSGEILNWQQLGGADQPVQVVSSPLGSGMRAAALELVLDPLPMTRRELIVARVADGDDQVARYPGGICLLSHSMVQAQGLKVVAVDGVAPSREQVAARRYPLRKPLLLVTRGKPRGAAAEFVEFALSAEGQQLLARHFFPLRPL
jgi:phosphate transport system substrate-binding protein